MLALLVGTAYYGLITPFRGLSTRHSLSSAEHKMMYQNLHTLGQIINSFLAFQIFQGRQILDLYELALAAGGEAV